ncbi:MAG: hypothetical protein GXP47_14400 [Acidobacteria bacterium]|nr:hypothetical protein [Acidobacteriota bacterium]
MVEARRIVDEFRILKLLKAAPQTTVFHAQNPQTGQLVVLKLLNALGGQPPEENRQRFLRAARTLREAGLPCLPEILDFGVTPDGRAFLVMSFDEGLPLTELEPKTAETVLPLLAGMADCLAGMARAGVVHHNLAPGNVDVIGGGVRLVGLGSAAFLGAGAAGGLMGHSPDWDAFAAPELMDAGLGAGQPPWKADLYSAALVACQALGASVETPGDANPAVVLPETVRTVVADPVGLEEVLATCLRHAPSERRVSLEELAETLRTGGEAAPMPDLADLGVPGPPSKGIAPPPIAEAGPTAEAFDPNRTRPSFTPEELASFVIEEEGEAPVPQGKTGTPDTAPGVRPGPPPLPGEVESVLAEEDLGTVMTPPLSRKPAEEPPAAPVPPEPPPSEDAVGAGPPGTGAGAGAPAPAAAATRVQAGWKVLVSRAGESFERIRAAARPLLDRSVRFVREADRRLLIGVAAGVVLAVILVVVFVVLRGTGGTAGATRQAAEDLVPAVVVVQPESGEAEAPEAPQLDPRLEEARAALDAGDVAAARKTLSALGPEELAAFGEEDRAAYDDLKQALGASARDRAVHELDVGLRRGDIRRLRRAVRALEALPRSELRGVRGLRSKMKRARKALQIHTLLWRAKKAGDDLQVIERAGALLEVLPAYGRATTLRLEAAKSVEARAAEAADRGRHAEALSLLEKEHKLWPQRAGLDAEIGRYRQEVERQRHLDDTLERAQKALDAGDPKRGLTILESITPTGSYVARFQDLQARLRQSLRARDAEAPKVMLQPGFKLRFKKNQDLVIPFLVTDDLGVASVTVHIRRKGERNYREVPLHHASGDHWPLKLTPQLHGNTTVELFVTATDGSGHTGSLGTAQRPLKVLRKRWYQK